MDERNDFLIRNRVLRNIPVFDVDRPRCASEFVIIESMLARICVFIYFFFCSGVLADIRSLSNQSKHYVVVENQCSNRFTEKSESHIYYVY